MKRTSADRPRRQRRSGPSASSPPADGGDAPASRSRSRSSSGPPPEELHPIDTPPDIESFEHWDLGPEIQGVLQGQGIQVPTPIQRLAIGPVMEGRDVIAKAETGTGKTLAFGAPMLARIDPARKSVLGLVLCPTRELAQQVAGVLRELGAARGVRVALLVGGDPMPPQIKELQAGAQVVVGTPGRVLDLYKQRFLSFPWTEYAVLDEADEMLEIGFLDDVEKILEFTPEERQTLLFSATFPPPLLALARKHTRDPVELATAKGLATIDSIAQHVYFLRDDDRPHVLRRMIQAAGPKEILLVFGERRTEVDRLMRSLDRAGEAVKALHGGFDQASRFRVMSAFRTGDVRALVATDVASRGLDVDLVTHVVNYSVPRDVSDYTHRIGRTGRAGRSGCAITFVAPEQVRRWRQIRARMNWDVAEVDERELFELFEGAARPARERGERGGHRRREERSASVGPRRDARGGAPEGTRQDAQGRGAAGERPRRRRSGDGRRSEGDGSERSEVERPAERGARRRAERPERAERPRGGAEPEPRRQRTGERPHQSAPPASPAGGFGAGLEKAPTPEPEPRPRRPREEAPAGRRSDAARPAPPPAGGGFGAGL